MVQDSLCPQRARGISNREKGAGSPLHQPLSYKSDARESWLVVSIVKTGEVYEVPGFSSSRPEKVNSEAEG